MVRSTNRETMADFAKALGGLINMANSIPSGAPAPRVADKTGLAGVYEFRLEFEGTAAVSGTLPPIPPSAGPELITPDPGAGGPTLFTALEKQLGLKLVKAKSVPVDVLVIDRLDKMPTEN